LTATEAVEVAPPVAPLVVDLGPVSVPQSEAVAVIDALVADVASVMPPAGAAAVVPPLDQSGVELATERATRAFAALNTASDSADPARDRLLVDWYKSLAHLGEQLVTLETMAADTGRPSWGTPTAAADLLDSICVSEGSVMDLDRLGRMWLTTEKRRGNGISLVATLGGSRQVGPYWCTRVIAAGGNADGSDRSLSIISRLAPPADPGERVVLSGVLFDGNAIWAADMRPIAPSSDVLESESLPEDVAPAP